MKFTSILKQPVPSQLWTDWNAGQLIPHCTGEAQLDWNSTACLQFALWHHTFECLHTCVYNYDRSCTCIHIHNVHTLCWSKCSTYSTDKQKGKCLLRVIHGLPVSDPWTPQCVSTWSINTVRGPPAVSCWLPARGYACFETTTCLFSFSLAVLSSTGQTYYAFRCAYVNKGKYRM